MSDNTTQLIALFLIILWVSLCAGTPDVLDAITKRVGGYTTEEMRGGK